MGKLLVTVLLFCILHLSFGNIPYRFSQNDYYPSKGSLAVSETKSSGAIRDVIKRNSPRFRKVLVRNTNSDIEYTNEDARYMTSRAKSKLDILASLTRSRWSTKIKVLKAWTDNVDRTDLFSLHYEGRGILLQLASYESRRLSDLMKLALEAGFNFVHYKNANSIHISVIPDVCQTKLDLAVVVDTSGSVGIHNFRKIQTFLKKLVDFFNIGRDETHMALISYSYQVRVEFPLNQYYDKWQLKQKIDRMWYQGSNTATGDALRTLVVQTFTTGHGMRPDKSIPKIGILMTDGRSNGGYNVYRAANEVKNSGINMFVVGITNNPRLSEINAIASKPVNEHYIKIERFTDLSSFVDQISTVSCDEGAKISKCENAETIVEGGSFKYFRVEVTSSVNIEVVDITGKSYLYTSLKQKNPGPLSFSDTSLKKNEDPVSPRTIAISNLYGDKKIVYISVQGQLENNKFRLNIWDSLFPQDVVRVSVDENTAAGHLVTTVKIKPNAYGVFKYDINYGNQLGHFVLDRNTGQIKTTTILDREVVSMYQLSIVAQDQREICHKGLMVLHVKVNDKNDNKPKFEKDVYQASIHEDAAPNQYVIQVKATDPDVGLNAELKYEIFGPQNDKDVFSIDVKTGLIKTAKALDFETKNYYELNLRVRDSSPQPKYGYAKLIIQVTDVNEAPRFIQPPCILKQTCLFTIYENENAGTGVGQVVNASDPDTKTACDLKYDITSLDGKYFTVGKTSGIITTKQRLDREQKEIYSLDIRVSDCGKPPLSETRNVKVKALDKNDNPPIFKYPLYRITIPENKQINAEVLKVEATDADIGNNAQIEYRITKSDAVGTFAIDGNNGQIILKKSLDRETKPKISLEVTAKDKGNPAISTTVSVEITVGDINDNRPSFTGSTQHQVTENVPKGTHVFTVTATDRDEGLNKKIRFSITRGNQNSAFKIFDSGRIETAGNIDREKIEFYKLEISARDLGKPSLSSTQTYEIRVNDMNDNAPVFSRPIYKVNIKENSPLISRVQKVEAVDADIGINSEIVFSIAVGNDGSTFTIDGKSGMITLRKSLDFGSKNFYRLKVMAKDKGTPSLFSYAYVEVSVDDSNDFKPMFTSSNYVVSLNENVNPNTKVVKVTATDADSGTSGEVVYSIIAQPTGNTFYVNSRTGQIFTRGSIDYEKTTQYVLTVKAKDKGVPIKYATSKVTVNINDLNDNTPEFNGASAVVLEDIGVGKFVTKLNADDRDSGDNGRVVFALAKGNVPFNVAPNGTITVSQGLDRETIDYYEFQVQASDQGSPVRSKISSVKIRIGDVNDNNPVFTKRPYKCSIYENAPKNSHICYIKATDADLAENGRVSYSLLKAHTDIFSIDTSTGQLKSLKSIDREYTAKFTLTVHAKDHGAESRDSQVTVEVEIKDENDNTPILNQKKYSYSIIEENDDILFGDISATDQDAGTNADVVFTILGGHIFAGQKRFSVQSAGDNKMKLKAVKLDREDRSEYKLTIRAEDKGRPSLSTTAVVDVTVTDINDNNPVLSDTIYRAKVKESVAVNTYVLTVSATDRDIGSNADISYKITSGNNMNHFTLDAKTGVLTTAVKLDYETVNQYTFNMVATDNGKNKRKDNAKIIITVENVDDNAPEFEKIKEVNLFEDVGIGNPVVQFKASDKDKSQLTFSITGGNNDNKFQVASKTGLMTLKNRLDREKVEFYNLTVEAKDSANSVYVHLPVNVLDVNDNKPLFSKPSYAGQINEDAQSGTFAIDANNALLTVHATDADKGTNAEIVYSIVGGNTNDAFAITHDSGEIRAAKKLDRENIASYVLRVAATDKGVPSLRSEVGVTIKVLDLNDNKPEFEKSSYTVFIAENTGSGAKLISVKATDADEGDNARVSYRITKNSMKAFAINQTTGEVKSTVNLDREVKDSHKITVEAYDHGATPLSSTTSITITVSDMNDNKPVITAPQNIAAVNESVKTGIKVTQVLASDDDSGTNAKLSYSIWSEGNFFSINIDNGEIFLSKILDRETKDSHEVHVTVSDGGSPRLSEKKIYKIMVADANDNPPEFKNDLYHGLVPENKEGRTKIATINAIDKDINENAVITYSIADAKGFFEIDSRTGDLYIIKKADYETRASFLLTIRASDWRHTVEVPCNVSIINLNDNDPIFTSNLYSNAVKENTARGVSVLNVKATDKDPFGDLEYVINSNVPFDIDSRSGVISVAGNLDYEAQTKYTFNVTAFDQGNPKLSGQSTVEVNLIDVNDNHPEFYNYSATINILENQPQNTRAFLLTATDKDSGINKDLRYFDSKIDGISSKDFTVNFRSGEVTAKRSFDREKEDTLTFNYYAADRGFPSLKSKKFVLTVNILDENDNSPVWQKDRYHSQIAEHSKQGTPVISVHATDLDQGNNGKVKYTVMGNKKFGITEQGIVFVNGDLDREKNDNYTLTLVASDNGVPSRQTQVLLMVTILDINDNAPAIDPSSLKAEILENKPANQQLVQVNATDADLGINAQIEFSMGNNDLFAIDPITGILKTLRPLDREEKDLYELTITAYDKGTPSLSSSAILTVRVLDVDDNCPVFKSLVYTATIEENAKLGTFVVQVNATDKDIGENAVLDYGIYKSNGRGEFGIDENGSITVVGNVDLEYTKNYHLVVRAGSLLCGKKVNGTNVGEGGKPVQYNYTLTNVYVTVTDINDNKPVFQNKKDEIRYNNLAIVNITKLVATDDDLGPGGQVSYRLRETKQGEVGGKTENYVLVEAYDHGVVPLVANFTLVVVNDIPCNAMRFSVSEDGYVTVNTLCTVKNSKAGIVNKLVGENAALECTSSGNVEDVKYRWTKNGDVISTWSDEGKLELQNMQFDQEGVYACVASSKAGVIQSFTTVIGVQEIPKIAQQPLATTVSIGYTATFKVVATGKPEPTYQWYRNGVLQRRFVSSVLSLSDCIIEDTGMYYCLISNANGTVKSNEVKLTVVDSSTVVVMKVDVNKPDEKGNCQVFLPDDLEKIMKKILSKKVVVTEVTRGEGEGKFCNITACSSNPCRHNGECYVTETGYQCVCKPEWTGSTCEKDQDECSQGSQICYNGGVCKNSLGSFHCECPSAWSGRKCEYKKDICVPSPCKQTQTCVPSQNTNYTCVEKSSEVTLILDAKDLIPMTDQKKFLLEQLLNRILTKQAVRSSRKRRSAVTSIDFGTCTIFVTSHQVVNSSKVAAKLSLDCSSKNPENTTDVSLSPTMIKRLCSHLFKNEKSFQACGQTGSMEKPDVKPVKKVTANVQVVVKSDNGKALGSSEAVDLMKKKGLEKEITRNNSGYTVKSINTGVSAEEKKDNKITIIVVVVCICVLLVVIVIALLIIRRRGKGGYKSTAVMSQRSALSPSDASTTELVPSVYEKQNLAYDDREQNNSSTFMFEMPKNLKHTNDRSPKTLSWYHGGMDQSGAEQLLSRCSTHGTYLLYANMDGDYVIGVRAPNGGPTVRHLIIQETADGKYKAEFGSMDPMTFNTIERLVDYYNIHSISFDEMSPDVIFAEPLLKSAL